MKTVEDENEVMCRYRYLSAENQHQRTGCIHKLMKTCDEGIRLATLVQIIPNQPNQNSKLNFALRIFANCVGFNQPIFTHAKTQPSPRHHEPLNTHFNSIVLDKRPVPFCSFLYWSADFGSLDITLQSDFLSFYNRSLSGLLRI